MPPFNVQWSSAPFISSFPARILIAVPKKKIRKAVKRNLLKRRIKEAYRLQKSPFYDCLRSHNACCSFAVIYSSPEIAEYKVLEEKILLVLQRLQKEYDKSIQ